MVQSLTLKRVVGIGLLMIICFLVGRYSMPAKTEIKEVEKIVKVHTEKSDKEEKGIVYENEIKRPDGTTEIKRTRIYDTKEKYKAKTESSHVKTKSTKTENLPSNQLGALYRLSTENDNQNSWTVIYNRRILGSIYGGFYVTPNSKLEYGISLLVGF